MNYYIVIAVNIARKLDNKFTQELSSHKLLVELTF